MLTTIPSVSLGAGPGSPAKRSSAELEMSSYTLGELMVAVAAREIRDGELVFVGMRLPLIAFGVAKKTHAPNSVWLYENGVIRSTPAGELIYTMADPPNILGATQCLRHVGRDEFAAVRASAPGFSGRGRSGPLRKLELYRSPQPARADTLAGLGRGV